jgi:hypothetical protein
MQKFIPPTRPGARFRPPALVLGRTGANFALNRKTEIPKQEPDDEEESTVPLAVTKRFSRMR